MFDYILSIDSNITLWFYGLRSDAGVSIFRYITHIGSTEVIVLLALIFISYLLYQGRYRSAGVFFAGLVANTLIIFLLKILVHRPRQAFSIMIESDYSFPSGHTAAAIFFFGFMLYYVSKNISKESLRITVRIFCLLFITLIPVSRLYLGAHYLTDVLASIIIASTVLYVTVKWWEKSLEA